MTTAQYTIDTAPTEYDLRQLIAPLVRPYPDYRLQRRSKLVAAARRAFARYGALVRRRVELSSTVGTSDDVRYALGSRCRVAAERLDTLTLVIALESGLPLWTVKNAVASGITLPGVLFRDLVAV